MVVHESNSNVSCSSLVRISVSLVRGFPVMETCTQLLDDTVSIGGIYFNFQNEYDTVLYERLKKMVNFYGIQLDPNFS